MQIWLVNCSFKRTTIKNKKIQMTRCFCCCCCCCKIFGKGVYLRNGFFCLRFLFLISALGWKWLDKIMYSQKHQFCLVLKAKNKQFSATYSCVQNSNTFRLKIRLTTCALKTSGFYVIVRQADISEHYLNTV